jgi:hypothetical protein
LFRDLADVFDGREPRDPPNLGAIVDVMLRHAWLLAEWMGEAPAMRAFRRQAGWYTKGFRGSARLRDRLMQVETLAELEQIGIEVDVTEPFPPAAMRVARGKTGGTQTVTLPHGYLDTRDGDAPPSAEAETAFSGG